MSKRKYSRAPQVPVNDWEQLRELIAAYAESYLADSWKGGGDPESYPKIEAWLWRDTLRLDEHIAKMQRTYCLAPRENVKE